MRRGKEALGLCPKPYWGARCTPVPQPQLSQVPFMGTCSFRLISPPMKYPSQAVIGGSSPPAAYAVQLITQAMCRCCLRNVGHRSRAASEAARELSARLSSYRRNQACFPFYAASPEWVQGAMHPGAELEAAEASNVSQSNSALRIPGQNGGFSSGGNVGIIRNVHAGGIKKAG